MVPTPFRMEHRMVTLCYRISGCSLRRCLAGVSRPKAGGFAGTAETPIPTELEVPVPESGDVLAPHFAVRSEPLKDSLPVMSTPGGGQEEDSSQWQLLVSICDPGKDFDRRISGGRGLEMSSHGQMERLLRHTHVTAGLLFNGATLRLVSAPRGESSGWVDFQVS